MLRHLLTVHEEFIHYTRLVSLNSELHGQPNALRYGPFLNPLWRTRSTCILQRIGVSKVEAESVGIRSHRGYHHTWFQIALDTVLNDDNWGRLRDLLDRVHDGEVRSQAKGFFARLFKAQDVAEVNFRRCQ